MPVSIGTEMAEPRINPSQVAVRKLFSTSPRLFDCIGLLHLVDCHLTYLGQSWPGKIVLFVMQPARTDSTAVLC